MVNLKRKRPVEPDTATAATTTTSLKRLRCNTLEHGFAHLNLSNSTTTSPDNDEPVPMDDDDTILPTSIDESHTTRTGVKPVAWYEPEKDRIVITDLDAAGESEPEDNNNEDQTMPSFEISPELLRRIGHSTRSTLQTSAATDPSACQALILFKPPPTLPELGQPPSKQDSPEAVELESDSSESARLTVSPLLPEDEDVAMMDVDS